MIAVTALLEVDEENLRPPRASLALPSWSNPAQSPGHSEWTSPKLPGRPVGKIGDRVEILVDEEPFKRGDRGLVEASGHSP